MQIKNILTFITNNSPQTQLNIGYTDECKELSVNTKFLGLQIENHLKCRPHKVNITLNKPTNSCRKKKGMRGRMSSGLRRIPHLTQPNIT
jgi:hypothetical protein